MNDKKDENILNLSLDRIMSDRFGRYSKYIIQDRALPDARDGLKPVQRRILFSMNDLGLLHNRAFKKSARVVGEVIGKYHPHGDSSIYEAMVRMSQNWKMNMPLIEMHGNNGSIDDDPAAAMRYTEARLSKIASSLLENIKKETVLFAPNFDDSEREPTVLPALFPNLLVNGAKGIAAGYATEMPPHNLNEVIDAIIAKIKSPEISLKKLMTYIHGPDFPTGGIVQGSEGIYQAFERGRGKIVIRSKYNINYSKSKPSITISQIPYGVIKSKLVKDIDEIRFNNKISGIKEIRDETDRKGISIYIELTSGTDVDAVVNYLLAKTELQVYYNYNSIAIKDKVPTQMSLMDLIDAYLKHQTEIQKQALNFVLSKHQKRLEIIQGLIKVAKMANQVIETIKKAQGSKQGVITSLIQKFAFTTLQATAIAELRLYRLSKTDQSIYLDEQQELIVKIAGIKKILASDQEFNNYLISLLKKIQNQYGVPRKTKIKAKMELISVNMDALIKHESIWIGISQDGYIKRFSNRAYEANNNQDYLLKEGDALIYLDFINTADKLLIFTNFGNYYFLPVHRVEETKFKEVGKNLNDFATKHVDEKIVDVIAVSDFNISAFVTLVSAQGKAKRVNLKNFEVTRHSKIYKAMKLDSNDLLVGARASNNNKHVIIVTSVGKCVKYPETKLPIQGPKSGGVRGISLPEGDAVSAFTLANQQDNLALVSKRGGAKVIATKAITWMGKTTQGKRLFRNIKGNPHVVTDIKAIDKTTKGFYSTNKITEFSFKKIGPTSLQTGFSQGGPMMSIFAVIASFDYINKNNLSLIKPTQDHDQQFDDAQQAIDNLGQINIDDLI